MRIFKKDSIYTNKIIKPKSLVHNNYPEYDYKKFYSQSIKDSDFWTKSAIKELHWDKPFSKTYNDHKWFIDGKINITFNCLDRHIANGNGNKIAYIYISEGGIDKKITYKELHTQVAKLALGLKKMGINKGDSVTIYMNLGIELIISMLAIARIGAIHSVVYGGFSAEALKTRIIDARSKVVITSSYTKRRGANVPLKPFVDEAIKGIDFIEKVIVNRRDDEKLTKNEVDFYSLIDEQDSTSDIEFFDSETPLFVLYTSGSTGKPKGIIHTVGGYNFYTHITTKLSFNLDQNDVYWCTADPGWITGHSYVLYGPLSNGVTSIIYEGAPDYPDPSTWWSIIEKYKVTKFYTAPTAIRMFMRQDGSFIKKHNLKSLKIIGTVGEPINPKAWEWYYENIGGKKAAVVDTWWQTETGGHMIVTMPYLPQKPGRAGLPFLGIEAQIVDNKGKLLPPGQKGNLVIKNHWPSALRDCFHNHERFLKYWSDIDGFYSTGDIGIRDKDGYFTVLGRSDDLIKVSGHRIGSAEIESALVANKKVAEAACIGIPDDLKGEVIKVFVVMKKNVKFNEAKLIAELKNDVRKKVATFATPKEVVIVDKLPKTRSGKIMRRVLRAKELDQDPGDVTTMED